MSTETEFEIEMAHQRDHYAILQGTVLRTIRSEVQMLNDAYSASTAGKMHVVQDHISRVMDALKQLDEFVRSQPRSKPE